jgi:hypothetical protein
MVYRVEIAGRVFQGTDPKALVRLAVQVRRGDQPSVEVSRRVETGTGQEVADNLINGS